jgi:hypothetical protein
VCIFPDLNTGNTTYKAVQQATKCLAIGPIMQVLIRAAARVQCVWLRAAFICGPTHPIRFRGLLMGSFLRAGGFLRGISACLSERRACECL